MPIKKTAKTKAKKVAKRVAKKAKKVAKRVVKKAKKGPVKKVVKKSSKNKKMSLVHASDDQSFWVTDGSILSNLVELRDALDAMEEHIFKHHVSKEKNDFADWIEHVLGDTELAAKVRKSKKSNSARRVVVSRLRVYKF